jgi:hypothetical protein
MKRRNFLKMMAGTASVLMPSAIFGKNIFPNENDSELSYHKLDRIKFSEVQLKYPR